MTPEPVGPRSGATLGFVAFIVFIDMVGLGLIAPVMPTLLETLTGETIDRTAEIGGQLLFAYALMQFVFSPVIGGLSDRFGRRPVLLLTLTMLGVDYLIMAWAPDLWWLFVGRLLSGIMGASWAAANSCIADVAKPEVRGRYFGLLGGAGASGFVIGPAIVQGGLTGLAIARFGPRTTCILGFAFGIPAYLLFAFATGSWAMIIGIVLGSFFGLTFPAMQQMMSERIDESAQGELQGAIASMVSLTSIIGPLVMTGLFGAFADREGLFFPGAPFALSVAFLVVAFGTLVWNLGRIEVEAA